MHCPDLPNAYNSLNVSQDAATLELLQRCEYSSSTDASHESFYLALFHRAIVERCEQAWYCLYTHYYPLVRYWVGLRGVTDADTQDDLTQEAFLAFWNCYTAEKLAVANGLASVLAYLKSCAFTVVAQWRRREKLVTEPLSDTSGFPGRSPETTLENDADTQQLLARLEHHCADKLDRLVARWVLVEGIKPAALVERYPQEFTDVKQVYRIKRNLVDRLQRDATLRAMRENS